MYNHKEDETSKLAHFQVVDKIYPTFESLLINNSSLFEKLFIAYSQKNQMGMLVNSIETNTDEIINAAQASIDLMARYRVYLTGREASQFSVNNALILLGLKLIELQKEKQVNPNIDLETQIRRFLYSSEYIKATGNIASDASLLKKSKEIIEYSVENNKKRTFESSVCINSIMKPLFENIQVISKDLNSHETQYVRTVCVCVLSLVISLAVGFVLFLILVNRVFSKEMLSASSFEVFSLKNKLKAAEDEIKTLKADLCMLKDDKTGKN